jgi:hypothetical protein
VLDDDSSELVAEVDMPGNVLAILKISFPHPHLITTDGTSCAPPGGRGYARLYHHNRAERGWWSNAWAGR